MVINVEMPKFGLSMEEGTIVAWLASEGNAVKKGDEIAEITTDKITNTVEAPSDGILRKILAGVGETVACGKPIAIIADENEDISPGNLSGINISPRAKKMAEEKGVDYSAIVGTGIGGAITIDDIKRYISEGGNVQKSVQTGTPASTAGQAAERKMSQMQSAIARRMFESLSTTAQTTISTDADITDLVRLYKQSKEAYKNEGYKLSYTAILVKAAAAALEKHPKIRTRMAGENILQTVEEINIGVAVDIEDGLVVPVIKNANRKDMKTICKELAELVDLARKNQLDSARMSGGTLTITNLGMFGIKYFTPVLNLPESAILGIGAITEQPVIKDGGIYTSSIMNMSLTHDHRVIDGAPAAKFLQEIKAILADFKAML